MADKNETIQQLIDNLNTTLSTLSKEGDRFSGGIDQLQRLVSALAADRDPIGQAIDALNAAPASLADLLSSARPPLAGAVDQLNRLAPALDAKKDRWTPHCGKPRRTTGSSYASAPTQLRQLLHLLDLGTGLGPAGAGPRNPRHSRQEGGR